MNNYGQAINTEVNFKRHSQLSSTFALEVICVLSADHDLLNSESPNFQIRSMQFAFGRLKHFQGAIIGLNIISAQYLGILHTLLANGCHEYTSTYIAHKYRAVRSRAVRISTFYSPINQSRKESEESLQLFSKRSLISQSEV